MLDQDRVMVDAMLEAGAKLEEFEGPMVSRWHSNKLFNLERGPLLMGDHCRSLKEKPAGYDETQPVYQNGYEELADI